ncbi:hypothetical protein [Desulfovibrio inopinatus]|uniref:hypothetical protein n=1 Tax=Desulfovibrio inopinatus TaxID=102109 RepID=UPI0012EBF098|nr:hypothetical protein [Desulfovibrio inopinatus]
MKVITITSVYIQGKHYRPDMTVDIPDTLASGLIDDGAVEPVQEFGTVLSAPAVSTTTATPSPEATSETPPVSKSSPKSSTPKADKAASTSGAKS